MKYRFSGALLVGLLILPVWTLAQATLSTSAFSLGIDASGQLSSWTDTASRTNILAADSTASLLSLRINGNWVSPSQISSRQDAGTLDVVFADGRSGTVQVQTNEAYLTLELVRLDDAEDIDLVCWGPYPVSMNESIGETIGVVQGKTFSVGLQALNPKTLGGYPWNENDTMPQIDIFENGNYSDLSEKGKRYVLYRVEAAKPTDFGATLQAYTRNRNQERVIENWSHTHYVAPAFDDGGVVGSRIALFGVPREKALDTIGVIEVGEGLPHPTINGVWSKKNPESAAAYLIMDFGMDTIDRAIELTERAGLGYLYHSSPFKSWGHFPLNADYFPNGEADLKKAVEKAGRRGIKIGLHTLSNFISTTDPYVTPTPDGRLARVGSSTLVGPVSATDESIEILDPAFFHPSPNDNLHAVVIGNELIRCAEISTSPPWILSGCARGAFDTEKSVHSAGSDIGRLADHGYKVFLTNPELTVEMAQRIAGIYNRTGVRQISFDGLEGNRSTGLGNYGEILFTQAWFDALDPEIRNHYIADASRTSHFFWHMYSRMNWGEPWYAGFRESQTEYRLKNQAYFQRNLMPGMLGWFRMTPETTVEDINWMLARSAAFDAGYAFVTGFEAIEKNQRTDTILRNIGEWEKARLTGAFSDDQKQRMQDISNEFELEKHESGGWLWTPVHSEKFRVENQARQPGEPGWTTFPFENPATGQPAVLIFTADKVGVSTINLELDGTRSLTLNAKMNPGDLIECRGQSVCQHLDAEGNLIDHLSTSSLPWTVSKGKHLLQVDAAFAGREEGGLKIELRFSDTPEIVTPKR